MIHAKVYKRRFFVTLLINITFFIAFLLAIENSVGGLHSGLAAILAVLLLISFVALLIFGARLIYIGVRNKSGT